MRDGASAGGVTPATLAARVALAQAAIDICEAHWSALRRRTRWGMEPSGCGWWGRPAGLVFDAYLAALAARHLGRFPTLAGGRGHRVVCQPSIIIEDEEDPSVSGDASRGRYPHLCPGRKLGPKGQVGNRGKSSGRTAQASCRWLPMRSGR